MAAAGEITMPALVKAKYTTAEELARGKFGVVFKCNDVFSKNPVAVKVMLKSGNKKCDVEREVGILRKLKHPSILAISEFMECDKEYVLVTELLNGGELFDYVIKKEYLDESEAVHYMKQILDGLNFCHNLNIVHLDLKPENIVLKEKDGKQLKIIDFGAAYDLNREPKVNAMVGTPEFIAPEVLNYDAVTIAADMWAVGIIAYVLLTGMSPFLGEDDMETIQNIACGEYVYPDPDEEEGYEDITALAKQFIDNLLVMKPLKRGTADDSLKHSWIIDTIKGSNSARISTGRLKALRAKRKWKAVGKVVGFLNRLRSISLSSDTETCPISPPASSKNNSCSTPH